MFNSHLGSASLEAADQSCEPALLWKIIISLFQLQAPFAAKTNSDGDERLYSGLFLMWRKTKTYMMLI